MSVVYKMSDRVKVKVDTIELTIGPLDFKVKSDIQSLFMTGKYLEGSVLAIKNGVKEINGLKLSDGSDYKLEFDSDGKISEDSINDIFNIEEAAKINLIAVSLINGIPSGEFVDPDTGKKIEGVTFVDRPKAEKKSKASRSK